LTSGAGLDDAPPSSSPLTPLRTCARGVRWSKSVEVQGETLEIGEQAVLESSFVSSPQDHAGRTARLQCFAPAGCTQAPAVTGLQAGKAELGIGVVRSLPQDLENSRNAAVMTAQTVWLPTSSPLVLQQPSRKKPVLGSLEQTSSRSPRTLRGSSGDLHRSRCHPSALPIPGPPPLPREFRHPPWEGRWRFARYRISEGHEKLLSHRQHPPCGQI
jgi:hypothetical protein